MFVRLLIAITGMVYGLTAGAQDFLDGWYFNPNQPGSGFNVNQQADVTALALFDFTVEGDTKWATAVAQLEFLDNGNSVFEAPLTEPENGACFDCPYEPNSGNIGGDMLRVEFAGVPDADGNLTALVTLRGTTEVYEQLLFRFSSVLDFLLSTWTLTAFQSGGGDLVVPLSEIVVFDSVGVTTGGVPFVAGELLSRPNSLAVAQFAPTASFQPGELVILADNVIGSDDQLWLFTAYKESLLGFTEIGPDPVTSIQNNADFLFSGHRFGNTINRNNANTASQSAAQAMLGRKAEIQPATPEMIALADRLAADLGQ